MIRAKGRGIVEDFLGVQASCQGVTFVDEIIFFSRASREVVYSIKSIL